ncbi:MAG TPA: ATP-binding protein [Planctomycetota bacterium]|nr:ATP-binding protein [Planctomycetota bacterium]
MITLIEALNYRCLRYVSQPLERFHVLVGPNASGKTTFLDVVAFLGRLVSDGLEAAIEERTANFHDLVWGREGNRFELAIEVQIPEDKRTVLPKDSLDTVRYEVCVTLDERNGEPGLARENVFLMARRPASQVVKTLFPMPAEQPSTIVVGKAHVSQRVITKAEHDNFYSEVRKNGEKGWFPAIRLGPRKSALANLPEDESKFPVSTWLKNLLSNGIQDIVLNSLMMRKASPPGRVHGFRPDGSNLPWVIAELQGKSPSRFNDWIAHIRTALPEVEDIRTVEREDDKHRYLVIKYRAGLEVPSWMASDGTLRLLALTLLAYLPDFQGVCLIEEPENGIHPRGVDSVFESLSSVYDAQVLVATHSAVVLSLVDPRDVLCFAKNDEGATDIVRGDLHPQLRDWKGEVNLAVLFAGGVLG